MRKILLLLVVLIRCVLVISAQEAKQEQPAKKGCSCAFSPIIQVGILHGSKGGYFQAQAINGIRYKTWYAGLGIGVDYYYRLSIPLFVDVRKYFFDKPGMLFLYADAGIDMPVGKKEKVNNWTQTQNVYSNGFYGDGGIGYALGGAHSKKPLLISAGYSYKNVTYKNESINGCAGIPCSDYYYTYKKYFHRLTVKLGFQL